MDNAEKKRSITVGIFVALGILVLVATIFTLGGQQKRFVKNIRVKSIFKDVSGLKAGNNVWFSGVKIGTVKSMKFVGNSEVEIEMAIEAAEQKYIRKNAKAKVSSEGMIGNKIIVIYGGTANSAPVEEGDYLKSEEALNTDEMMATLQENNKNVLDITRDFKFLSKTMVRGKGTLGAFLTDSVMAANVKATVVNLDKASQNAIRITAAVNQLIAKMNTKGGLADNLFTDTTVFNDIKTAVNQLNQATATASEITSNLKQTTDKLNASNNAVGVLLNDEQAATRIRNTLGNLESSSKKLDEDLEALQHNFLLKGFFKKKEKAEAEAAKP
ncbi:MAG: hypothetical protein K0S09_1494 [Sphingobacteriaceae bacterium]|jgi:phospholipid/cholesterol/gamma-HCH transport system substrate-binding protein|nr:hypothetical protein [Sphingobacteriaceae bacterium]